MTYFHHYSMIQSNFTALKLLCALSVHPLAPYPNPGNHYLFTVSIILPFLKCHLVEIIKYVVFSDQPLSLNDMHLMFLYVFSWLDSPFLFSTENYSFVWMYHSLFIHSPIGGHLGWFKVLEITNKAAMNICV